MSWCLGYLFKQIGKVEIIRIILKFISKSSIKCANISLNISKIFD